MTSFKIAIIGAGSVGFTRKLFADILCVPEFADIEVALTDISQHNLDMIETILKRTVAANRLPTKITATTDRRKAIEGARYVISCVRVGGLDAYADDIRIPLKYGVDQCVGDTICAGGILYGQRNIPVILDFCRDIRELAEPNAKFLNYANPMAMNTWAAIEYGKVDTIGLCHGVQHGADQIAEVLGAERSELDYVCSGINHQTWFIDVRVRGRKIGKDELIAAFEAHPVYSRQEKLRIDVLKRFGVYSTESNGHLSEYLPWYRKRPDELAPVDRHVRLDPWRDGRLSPPLHRDPQLVRGGISKTARGGLEADRSRRPLQRACQPHIGGAGDRPRLSRAFQRQERRHHRQSAARRHHRIAGLRRPLRHQHGGRHHACRKPVRRPAWRRSTSSACRCMPRFQAISICSKLAVLHDPLVGAICTPEEVWQMVDEMVVAQAEWLPQYAHAIDGARDRLSRATVKTREWKGVASRPVRPLEQIRAERMKAAE